MFFNLSKTEDPRFQHRWKIGNYTLHTDNGWQEFVKYGKRAIAKGACMEAPLSVAAFQSPRYRGTFVSIIDDANGPTITHGILRGFPLWRNSTSWTNMSKLELVNYDTYICHGQIERYNPFPHISKLTLELDDVISLIDGYIEENVQGLIANNDVTGLECTVTGGVDTSLIWSYLESLGVPHRSSMTRHFAWDRFIMDHKLAIDDVAGWIDLHNINHYEQTRWITTGGNGDAMFVRDIGLPARWLAANGVNMLGVTLRTDYMFNTIMDDPSYVQEWKSPSKVSPGLMLDTLRKITYINDFFHFNNTMFFNPLQDMRISAAIMRLDPLVLARTISDATIQKELIKRRAPWMHDCISQHKNVNPRLNFFGKTDDTRYIDG